MPEKHELPVFKASISTQGMDKHLHIPRKLYPILKEKGLLNKKFKIKITLEELED